MYKKITIVGTGYVGLSLATLLSQTCEVIAFDIDETKVDLINKKISPIEDSKIQEFFAQKNLNLIATLDRDVAFKDTDLIIIATPTDYDENTDQFNTSSIEVTMEHIVKNNLTVPIVIKSTIPIGYTDKLKEQFNYDGEIMFSPEFLREGRALEDNLYPSRIVLGSKTKEALEFGNLLKQHALNKESLEVFLMSNKDAEAVKLFSNTFLAMRVSFFNELDTFAEVSNLDSNLIIKAVSADPRIGDYYNNPSFGYGGYCLPKDTKQLKANYTDIPESIITSIVESNAIRKQHIAQMILNKNPQIVGVYKLAMKAGSDNFRQSSIIDVIKLLEEANVKVMVFEPNLPKEQTEFNVMEDLDEFKKISDVILTNRYEKNLNDVIDKVYSRDVFNRD